MMMIKYAVLVFVFASLFVGLTIDDSFSQPNNHNLTEDENQKFDTGFYDKVLEKINAKNLKKSENIPIPQEEAYHDVIIVLNKYEHVDLNENQSFMKKKNDLAKQLTEDKVLKQLVGGNEEKDKLVKKLQESKPKFIKKDVSNGNKNKLVYDLVTNHDVSKYFRAQHLSFVTAQVPIDEIPKLASYEHVVKIGDGRLEVKSLLDVSTDTIGLSNISSSLDGSGIRVAVLDTGISQNHNDLPIGSSSKIVRQAICDFLSCDDTSTVPGIYGDSSDHGTHVAGIVGGIGNGDPSLEGVAPGIEILNARVVSSGGIVHAYEWAILNDAKVINQSIAIVNSQGEAELCSEPDSAESMALIADEVVDINGNNPGVLLVVAAGNDGNNSSTITTIACAHNVITVGNQDDKGTIDISDDGIRSTSSRGPTDGIFVDGRLKPEIVAPGSNINSPSIDCSTCYSSKTGTSFAAPHVSGASAIILQDNPTFTPDQVRAALFVGANWTPFTSIVSASSYEDGGSSDVFLNGWGMGSLNIEESIQLSDDEKVLQGQISQGQVRTLTLPVIDGEQVKVVLTWRAHPFGTIPNLTEIPLSNLDFVIKNNFGDMIAESDSQNQNIEFVVFDATETAEYTINVSANSISSNVNIEDFAIASTHQIAFGTSGSNLNAVINNDLSSTVNIFADEGSTIFLDGSASTGPPGFTFFWEEQAIGVSNPCNFQDITNENGPIATVTINSQSEDCLSLIKLTVSSNGNDDTHQALIHVTDLPNTPYIFFLVWWFWYV